MNTISFVAFFVLIAAASASIVAPAASVLQGPSSRTTLVGPEGSIISSVAPGGQVITDSLPGVVARTAPLVAASPLVAAPALIARSAPIVSVGAAPLLAGGIIGDSTEVAGPSGTIATGRSLSTPVAASSIITGSGVIVAPGIIGSRSILL